MLLKLNVKEWQALQVLLESAHSHGLTLNVPEDGKVLDEVRKRMRAVTQDALKEIDRIGDFQNWFSSEREKIVHLKKANEDIKKKDPRRGPILTADDDEEETSRYPKRPPRMPKPGRKGRHRQKR